MKLVRACFAIVPAILAFNLLFAAEPADWPQFRGPGGQGHAAAQGLPHSWSENENIVWKCPLPEWGTSTPAIVGDAIFVTSHTPDNKLLLIKIDRVSGQALWKSEVGSGEAMLIKGNFLAEPAPAVELTESSKAYYEEKVRFETDRWAKWFGD